MPRSPRTQGTPRERASVRPYLLLAVALFAVGLASWRPVPAGVWNDDGVYLVIGKSLAEGEGLRYAGVPGDVPAVKFPPLYPMVLGALWAVLGGIGAVTLASAFLNLALLSAAGALVAFALRRSGLVHGGVAMALGGLAFLSAHLWRIGLVPLSESLFVFLTAAALACWPAVGRPASEEPSDRRGLVLLSAMLTAAVLTRSAGVALLAGFGVSLFLVRGLRRAATVVLPPVVAAAAWAAWSGARAGAIPEGMRDVLGPYGGWWSAQVFGAPAEFLGTLPAHVQAIVRLVLTPLLPGLSGAALLVAGVVAGTVIVYGLALLLRRFPPIAWVTCAYGGMLVLWPFVDGRLVAPLHPLLVVAAGVGLIELWRLSGRHARPLVAGLAALWVAGYAGVSAWRVVDGWAVSAYRVRSERLATAVETLQRTAPPDAVVGAPEFWAALHLHGGWPAVPSALFLPRARGDVPVWGTAEDQIALWRSAGVEYLLLETGGLIHGDALNRVEERCPGAVAIVARMPPQMLVRLQWSETCVAALGLQPVRR